MTETQTVQTVLDIVIAGLLLGGLYALIAMGLSLQYGVARVLNVAHGEFIMLGGMGTWWLFKIQGVNPIICIVICGPLAFGLGFLIHRYIFRYLLKKSPSQAAFEGKSLLASFGLSFIIMNIAFMVWGPDIRGYSFLKNTVDIGGALFGANRYVTLGFSLAIGLIFYLFLVRSRLGKAIRAAAQDPTIAGLMGININFVLAFCFGLGAAMAAIAGVLISMSYPVSGAIGIEYTIIAIIVVVLGGLGSILGSFIGGFLLGLVGSVVSHYDPGLTLAAYYLLFVLLLLVRPTGLFGK